MDFTTKNLIILIVEARCHLCADRVESILHSFFYYGHAKEVWQANSVDASLLNGSLGGL